MGKKDSSLYQYRNTEGLKIAALEKRKQCFHKAEEGIKKLLKEGKPINFESVAEAANVTRSWLYNQPELRNRIETLRAQQTFKGKLPPQIRATDKSKDALILGLRKQNKQLRARVQELGKELEIAYGRAFGIDKLQLEIQDLQRQNQNLSNLLTEVRVENQWLRQQQTVAVQDSFS